MFAAIADRQDSYHKTLPGYFASLWRASVSQTLLSKPNYAQPPPRNAV